MKNRKSYYQILHVQPDAPSEVIRSSYRTMMQQLKMHPDLGGNHEDAALVNEAYKVLMNSTARAEYDASLERIVNKIVPESKDGLSENFDYTKPQNYTIDITKYCPFCHSTHNLGKTVEPASMCTVCDSPLFPAIKHVFEDGDQRIIQRIDKQWPVTFYTHWPQNKIYTGQTQDVSLNGMQMICDINLENGLIIKANANFLDAVARVVNNREDYTGENKLWRVGLEFLTLRLHRIHGTFLEIEI